MNRDFWKRHNRNRLKMLCRRFADGSSSGEAGAAADQSADPPAKEETDKAYTATDLESARAAAVEAYKQHLEDAKDYDKMTAEEKVAFLEQQRADDKITQYAAAKVSAQELPPELIPFIKGKTEAETDEKLKVFQSAFNKGVQAGVEKRFQTNGYLPRGSAASGTDKNDAKRVRGVTVK